MAPVNKLLVEELDDVGSDIQRYGCLTSFEGTCFADVRNCKWDGASITWSEDWRDERRLLRYGLDWFDVAFENFYSGSPPSLMASTLPPVYVFTTRLI